MKKNKVAETEHEAKNKILIDEAAMCIRGMATREIAEKLNRSKSAVHYDLTVKLQKAGMPTLYKQVTKALKVHKEEAPGKGGQTTKERWAEKKNAKEE